jgi:hypothetical protein
MLEHTIVSHLSKKFLFFNCFVEDGIQREKERMNVLFCMIPTLSTLHLLKSRLKTDAEPNAKKENHDKTERENGTTKKINKESESNVNKENVLSRHHFKRRE